LSCSKTIGPCRARRAESLLLLSLLFHHDLLLYQMRNLLIIYQAPPIKKYFHGKQVFKYFCFRVVIHRNRRGHRPKR
jgi:hypothetical protein